GRVAEKAATGITEQLVSLGFESDRLKTGTPPRIDGRSLDYSKMEEQKGDEEITGFSFLDQPLPKQQRSCWITYTNSDVHETLKTGFNRSPMFAGRIEGTGPRYCPSIEDKINRFAERDRHQLFVEPEGWNTVEIYVNGFSTSLPEEVQYEALRKVPGFENVKMFRPGYAIEYDYFPPTQLRFSLETKQIQNLFFAGQINGTTGYEEAACQGLMAGINAHLKINEKPAFVLKRSEAYIGVLIDDLINKGTEEPYRMFTSRAEFRTLLRQDNADIRLTPMAIKLGLASEERIRLFEQKRKQSAAIIEYLTSQKVTPEIANPILEKRNLSPIREKTSLAHLLKRPQLSITDLEEFDSTLREMTHNFTSENVEHAEIEIKYHSYIEKERLMVEKTKKMENHIIPDHFNFGNI